MRVHFYLLALELLQIGQHRTGYSFPGIISETLIFVKGFHLELTTVNSEIANCYLLM